MLGGSPKGSQASERTGFGVNASITNGALLALFSGVSGVVSFGVSTLVAAESPASLADYLVIYTVITVCSQFGFLKTEFAGVAGSNKGTLNLAGGVAIATANVFIGCLLAYFGLSGDSIIPIWVVWLVLPLAILHSYSFELVASRLTAVGAGVRSLVHVIPAMGLAGVVLLGNSVAAFVLICGCITFSLALALYLPRLVGGESLTLSQYLASRSSSIPWAGLTYVINNLYAWYPLALVIALYSGEQEAELSYLLRVSAMPLALFSWLVGQLFIQAVRGGQNAVADLRFLSVSSGLVIFSVAFWGYLHLNVVPSVSGLSFDFFWVLVIFAYFGFRFSASVATVAAEVRGLSRQMFQWRLLLLLGLALQAVFSLFTGWDLLLSVLIVDAILSGLLFLVVYLSLRRRAD